MYPLSLVAKLLLNSTRAPNSVAPLLSTLLVGRLIQASPATTSSLFTVVVPTPTLPFPLKYNLGVPALNGSPPAEVLW